MLVLDDLATAHSEGKTFAKYYHSESSIVTCGDDGDIRVYPGLHEDETLSISTAEKILSLTLCDEIAVIGTEKHQVKTYNLKDSSANTILEFTSQVNHVCVSSDKNWIGAGSSDFKVKLVKKDSSEQLTFTGHDAPVLSLIVHGENMVSSSCDGTLKIWNISDQKCINSVKILPVFNSYEKISVMSFDQNNSQLAVPVNKSIKVVSATASLESKYELTEEHTELITVSAWSPSGKLLASASVNGEIFVWEQQKCIKKFCQHEKKEITSLEWNPKDNGELLFADVDGEFGFCEVPATSTKEETSKKETSILADLNDLEDLPVDDEDDKFDLSYRKMKRHANAMDVDEDSNDVDNAVSAKKKHRINNMDNFLDDEPDDDDADETVDDNNISLNLIKEGLLGNLNKQPIIEDDDDLESLSNFIVDKKPAKPVVEMKTYLQPPFQPSSTPAHLMHRFMTWNSVGIIRCHSEDISNIDVEFHDASTHHPLHMANVMNNTMATMSSSVVVFACEKDNDMPSKLTCLHFGSWDSNKEWTIPMSKDDNIKLVAANEDFVACATSLQFLRIFTVAGVQSQLLYLPGNIVTMAMINKKLMVVYHKGAGINNHQIFGIQHLVYTKHKCWKVVTDETFQLREKFTLTWAGYSAEGTPALVDSSGTIFLKQLQQNSWIPICNIKSQVKNKSDNYWVIGIQEKTMQIRCVYCKGANFPATLPRPVPTVIPFQLPLLEITTEKSKLEHDYMVNSIVTRNLEESKYTSNIQGEYDELEKKNTQLLIRLFALACKADRDYRAVEICKLMPDVNSITFAIQYASKQRKVGLAKKLDQLARDRVKEVEEEEEEIDEEDILLSDDDDFTDLTPDEPKKANKLDSLTKASSNVGRKMFLKKPNQIHSQSKDEDDLFDSDNDDIENSMTPTPTANIAPQPVGNSNPFKVAVKKPSDVRGTALFDNLTTQKPKNGPKPLKTVNIAAKKTGGGTRQIKINPKNPVLKSTLKDKSNIKNTMKEIVNEDESKKKLSGFQMFLNHQKENHEGVETEEDFADTCTNEWRELPKEQKREWNEKAKNNNNSNSNDKSTTPKTVKLSGKDKLSSFAFGTS